MKLFLLLSLLCISGISSGQETSKYHEEDVSFWNKTDSVQLHGTLTIPTIGKKFPVVLLITGSGPQDRNETILGHKPFKAIAEYLGDRGFAVLRYDDRGGGKMNKVFTNATIDNFIKDASAGVDFLKTRTEINPKKIGLLGHSEGGSVAPVVATQRKDIAFVVLMAAPGVKHMELMKQQNRDLFRGMKLDSAAIETYVNDYYEDVFSGFGKGLDSTQQSQLISSKLDLLREKLSEKQLFNFMIPAKDKEAPYIRQVYQTSHGKWFQQFINFDPSVYLEQLTVPTLAVNGTKDVQVNADLNLRGIEKSLKKAGNKNYKIVKLEGLNHLMLPAKTGLPQEYATIKGDIDPAFLETVYHWLHGIYP
ncbi:alpha/beta fold hydrolase [Siphonobacter sp. SORGH_AS_0500]|uniref:alpha/beta hydrolase family protein n=1 Tax=Siphonobacter sp. SORGH_AS_0500 TaxID=1864824 RepID=UPI002866C65D|nr:alpha/beta fold hydrolase [Siphonobacter sp. SORGH_AS_0500]MDR6195034.1 pimeloyl-ACP methyl ester carboxylesterase [Siphonobacter sp. SORGH_AS_0500]